MDGGHYKTIPSELLDALLDNPYESQILVDGEGIVRFVSSQAKPYYGGGEALVGRHIRELNPQSELPRVLATGKAEIGRLFRLGERERFVARIPLKDQQGKVIGAVGKLLFWDPEKIRELLRELEVLEGRLDYYERQLEQIYKSRYTLDKIVGESKAMREVKRMAMQAAFSDLPVLITGETGTGKEMLAQAIHNLSRRGRRPMVKVNCAAIPPELFESELFGYEPGAFTGASRKGKPGKFELADGGTIFLDEVGELPGHLQAKLLRVIQDKEVERIGSVKPIALDFRVIAATNRDLKEMLSSGGFRKDLFYRLATFSIRAPSLREIPEDIPKLAYHFLEEMRRENPRAPRKIDKEAMDKLMAYPWPGNARELRNVLERASLEAGRGPIKEMHLPREIRKGPDPSDLGEDLRTMKQELQEAEKRAIRKALARTGGNKSMAAKILGIHRTVLYEKMKKHGLHRSKLRT